MTNGHSKLESIQNEKQELSPDSFLVHVKGLLDKGFTPETIGDQIRLITPDGSTHLSVLSAVYEDMTGKDAEELNAPDVARELGIPDKLLDQITEATADADSQWPEYRRKLEEALGIE